MVEEQRKIDEERQKIKRAHEKKTREEQKIILGKNNARPKISFSIWAVQQTAWALYVLRHTSRRIWLHFIFSFFQEFIYLLQGGL